MMTEELNYSLIDLLNPVWKIASHYRVHPSNMVDVFKGFYRLTDYVSKIEEENAKLKKENANLKKRIADVENYKLDIYPPMPDRVIKSVLDAIQDVGWRGESS